MHKRLVRVVLIMGLAPFVSGAEDVGLPVPREEVVIFTPNSGPAPHINGPKVYGCRPGHPFLYRIPCTGERPMQISAAGLPASLKLDATHAD